jgi:hypothetical protein
MDPVSLPDNAGSQGFGGRSLRQQALWRRAVFFGLTFLTALAATLLMLDILKVNGQTLLNALALPLFFVLFTWISGAFWTAVAGFIVRLVGHDPAVLQPRLASQPLRGKTAIVVPIYNEDTVRVFAAVDAIWWSLQQQAAGRVSTSTSCPIRATATLPTRKSPPGRPWWHGAAPPAACSTAGAATMSGANPATSPSSYATGAALTTT